MAPLVRGKATGGAAQGSHLVIYTQAGPPAHPTTPCTAPPARPPWLAIPRPRDAPPPPSVAGGGTLRSFALAMQGRCAARPGHFHSVPYPVAAEANATHNSIMFIIRSRQNGQIVMYLA